MESQCITMLKVHGTTLYNNVENPWNHSVYQRLKSMESHFITMLKIHGITMYNNVEKPWNHTV